MSDNNNKKTSDEDLDAILSDVLGKKNKNTGSDASGDTSDGIKPERRQHRTEDQSSERPARESRREGRPDRENSGERPRRPRPADPNGRSEDRPRKKKPRPEQSEGAVRSGHTKKKSASAGAAEHKATRSSNGNKKPKRKKWSAKKKTFVIIGIIVFILCLLALGVYLILHHYWSMMKHEWDGSTTSERIAPSSMERPDLESHDTFDVEDADAKLKKHLEENAVDVMSDKDVFNVLLIGQDLRSTEATGSVGNTDVMILMSLNKKNKTITMTSFMRDIYLYLPEYNYSNRLNAAYAHGGPDYLANVLQSYFGVKIDRYVNVTFNSFIKVVDALGGLDIFVKPEEAMGYEDADHSDLNNNGMIGPLHEQNDILGYPVGTDYITMDYSEKGRTIHMNGNQALAYARLRNVGNNDFERTERQRKVISYIIEKVKGASLSELNDLANKVLGDITTTITEGETFSLVLNALSYANYDIQEMRIPEEGTYSGHFIRGASVILCNTVKNAQDLQMLIYGETNIDEAELRRYENQNKYLDDKGNWIDYYNGGPDWNNFKY